MRGIQPFAAKQSFHLPGVDAGFCLPARGFRRHLWIRISAGVWERLRLEGFRVEEAKTLLGLESATHEGSLLPHHFVAMAVEVWQRGQLNEGQLTPMLRVDRLQPRETISRFCGSREADAARLDRSGRFCCSTLRDRPWCE